MSSNVTLNGVQYIVPAFNDTGWAQGVGNLSLYLVAIASNTLQPTGGAFTLTSELDFGANFGVKQLYLKSETANPASAGVVRLAKTDSIKWRNNANGADIALAIDGSDNLQYNTTKVLLSGAVVNADINAAAAIAYSKLALTNSIVNADIASAAAIAYSKLSLTASIVNADIASAAAIAVNKLAALTVSRAMVTDGSGFASASAVTATELGYVSGVTSAIQTQLNATVANPLTANLAAGSHKITGLANGTASTDAVAFGQLKILQAPVYITASTAFSTTSSTFQTTNLTGSITPTSSASRILVLASGTLRGTGGSLQVFASLFNGSTNLGGTAGISQMYCEIGTKSNLVYFPISLCAIDSPASTSSQTYSLKIRNDDNATGCGFGTSSQTQTMILVEVA